MVSHNQLTGCLPRNLLAVKYLVTSGNKLEGTMPKLMGHHLLMLGISGQPGRVGALTGLLPAAIARCRFLIFLATSWQALEGIIPPLTATLQTLSLQNNKFKVMSAVQFRDRKRSGEEGSSVLVHNNLLSCDLPRCSNTSVMISLSGLGNQLSRPRHGFPAWVSPLDRDRLFWSTGTEGVDLLMKAMGASGLLAIAAATKGHAYRLWRFQAQEGHLLRLTFQCFRFLACVTRGALLRVLFLMLLLSWDLYTCPQTMSLASACLRDDSVTHILVLLMWGFMGFNGYASQWASGHMTNESEGNRRRSHKGHQRPSKKGKLLLLQLLFVLLQVLLSLPGIFLQVCKSVPGGLGIGGDWVGVMISTCIGGIQAVLGTFVVPCLAEKLTERKHVYATLANLLLNCVFPAAVIICLDLSATSDAIFLRLRLRFSDARADRCDLLGPKNAPPPPPRKLQNP